MHHATTGLFFEVWDKTRLPYSKCKKHDDFTLETRPWATGINSFRIILKIGLLAVGMYPSWDPLG